MGMFAPYRGWRAKACGVTSALFLSQEMGLGQGTVALLTFVSSLLPLLSRMASADDLVGSAWVWTGSVSCGHIGSGL